MMPEEGARIIRAALVRTGREPKADRGWNWVCYCATCALIRKTVQAPR